MTTAQDFNMKRLILLAIMALTLSSCSLFRPHRNDVDQGNVITPQEVNRLHKGMSENDVKDVMGNPVATNIFDDNRMNFIYTIQRGYDAMQEKRVVCVFEYGRLVDIQRG